MERFIPVECFRKKGNTFRGIPFSRFFRNSWNFCTICPQLPVPGYFREDSNVHDGGFK